MNYNAASSTKYKLEVPGLTEFNYFIQRTTLPGMRQEAIRGGYLNNITMTPGETIEYDPLTVDIIVDEDYKNILTLQEWLISNYAQEKPYSRDKDIVLHILNKNSEPSLSFTFFHAFPTDIQAISLDSTLNDEDVNICTATFAYQNYRLNK